MKICFLSSMHTPTDKRVFDKEARSLAEKGFDVVHVAPGECESGTKDGVFLEVYPPSSGIIGRFRNMRILYRKAKSIYADVYHCNEVDSWLVGILLKFVLKKKVVFDVHENYPEQVVDTYFPPVVHPMIKFVLRTVFILLIPFTDYFVLAKESVARDFPGTERKRCVVRNLSYLRHSVRRDDDVQESIKELYVDRVTAVHLGLFSKARGWPQLIEAMRLMENKVLNAVFIGSLNDGSQDEFNEKIRQDGLDGRIRVLSWMPFEQAYDHVLCCQIGLVLFQPVMGNEYAYPHKMFDYMLAGIPIIVPDFAPTVCDIVKEADCGLMVDTTSPAAIAEALDHLLYEPEVAKRLGENGRKAVLEKYNWESEFKNLLSLYNSWL